MDNGVKRDLVPIANKRQFLEVSGDIMEHVDPVFYGDYAEQQNQTNWPIPTTNSRRVNHG